VFWTWHSFSDAARSLQTPVDLPWGSAQKSRAVYSVSCGSLLALFLEEFQATRIWQRFFTEFLDKRNASDKNANVEISPGVKSGAKNTRFARFAVSKQEDCSVCF
jgi:hypothetical protein